MMMSWQHRRLVLRGESLDTVQTGTSEPLLGVSTAANLTAGSDEGDKAVITAGDCMGDRVGSGRYAMYSASFSPLPTAMLLGKYNLAGDHVQDCVGSVEALAQ